MNKFLLFATILAVAFSVSYAMQDSIDDIDEDEIQAMLQEVAAMDKYGDQANAQWGRFRIRRVFRKVARVVKKVASKVCKYAPMAGQLCPSHKLAQIENDDERAEAEYLCTGISLANKACSLG